MAIGQQRSVFNLWNSVCWTFCRKSRHLGSKKGGCEDVIFGGLTAKSDTISDFSEIYFNHEKTSCLRQTLHYCHDAFNDNS
jgi:hypothetical protein